MKKWPCRMIRHGQSFFTLVVFSVDFKVGLGVGAGGAQLGCLGADDQVTAVTALPDLDLALGEDLLGLDIVQQCAVALLVVLLDGGNQTELGGQLGV